MKSPLGISIILIVAAFLLIMSYKTENKSDNEELQEIRREIEKLKQAAEADAEKTDE